jgi:putative Holliday junction resolvase
LKWSDSLAEKVIGSGVRLLGIDYGTKRIGLALSDPLGIIATPLETIANDALTFERIAAIVEREHARTVVVGMPFNLKGEKSKKAKEVEEFIARLKKHIRAEIIFWDERFTSTIAQQTLRSMGAKKKDRQNKSTIDSMAAAIILQDFLNSTKHSRAC